MGYKILKWKLGNRKLNFEIVKGIWEKKLGHRKGKLKLGNVYWEFGTEKSKL